MNRPVHSIYPRLLASLTAACLTACGGGNALDESTKPSSSTESTASNSAVETTQTPAAVQREVLLAPSEDEKLALALVVDNSADSPATPVADHVGIAQALPTLPTLPALPALGGDRGGQTDILRAEKSVHSMPSTSGTATAAGTPNTVYVDSRFGNDANDGLASVSNQLGSGPWKTLGRLAQVALNPGDAVRLACGSTWNETLTIASSGTAAQPISIGSQPASCTNLPTIDGSTVINPGNWTPHQGKTFKAALAVAPLSMTGSSGVFTIAHHPNRGHDASSPSSSYFRLGTDSDATLINGRTVSTTITTGPELKLPLGASITVGTGVRTRTTSWVLNESTVSAVAGNKLSLSLPTSFRLKAGWGYFFVGQPWMVDSPGEWYYDEYAKVIYAWMPNSLAPAVPVYASQRTVGINLLAKKYITVDGLFVRRVGTGISLLTTEGIVVRNSRIEDTTDRAIYSAASVGNVFQRNTISRAGSDAISGDASTGMTVTGNTIDQSGVRTSLDSTVVSIPSHTTGSIRPGAAAQVVGNRITNTGYSGIWVSAGSTVSSNYISGTCAVLDDCAGIYAEGANNNSVIANNIITHSRGAPDGKPLAMVATQAQGIYLDNDASGMTVEGNTVIDADTGIQLHIASNNTIKFNKLYGNRINQLWIQENSNKVRTTGDVFGNIVTHNQLVPNTASSRGFMLESSIKSTELFGQFDWNRYFDRVYSRVAADRSPVSAKDMSVVEWKAAVKQDGTLRNQDPNAYSAAESLYASYLTNGANIVSNSKLSLNLLGWSAWNQATPYGQLTRTTCLSGYCLRYVAGASEGLISTPNFSLTEGKWYRVSGDTLAGRDGQPVALLVRRGGGGGNGYEPLTAATVKLTASRSWQRFSYLFQARKSVLAADPVTLDKGARLDFQQIKPGDSLTLRNIEIVPTTPADATTRTDILVNSSPNPSQASCPIAIVSTCASYVRFSDNAPVTWPYYLVAGGTEIVYTRDIQLLDSDGDGIADSQDQCPSTTRNQKVDSAGCSVAQRP